MLLLEALRKSMNAIATRAGAERQTVGKVRWNNQVAFATSDGKVFVVGRNGMVRHLEAADQLRKDWTAYQPWPELRKKKKRKLILVTIPPKVPEPDDSPRKQRLRRAQAMVRAQKAKVAVVEK